MLTYGDDLTITGAANGTVTVNGKGAYVEQVDGATAPQYEMTFKVAGPVGQTITFTTAAGAQDVTVTQFSDDTVTLTLGVEDLKEGFTFESNGMSYKVANVFASGNAAEANKIVYERTPLLLEVSALEGSAVYNGEKQRPNVTVKNIVNGNEVTGAQVTYYRNGVSDNSATKGVDAGTYTATYKATTYGVSAETAVEGSFTIAPADLSAATIVWANGITEFDSDASATDIANAVTATLDGFVSLNKDSDYKVTVDTTARTVTIEPASGNFTGSKTASYTVKDDPAQGIDLSKGSMEISEEGHEYAFGEEVTPAVVVKDANGETLVENTDYTVAYETVEDGVWNAGEEVTVTVEGMGAYEGELEGAFEIDALDLKDATVTVDAQGYVYNGKAQTVPAENVSVEIAGHTLTNGIDYTLAGTTGTDADDYHVVATANNSNFANSTKNDGGKWSIAKLSLEGATCEQVKDLTWAGTDIKLADAFGQLAFKVAGITVPVGNYAVTFANAAGAEVTEATAPGAYTMTVAATLASKNFTGSAEFEFSVGAATITAADVKWTGFDNLAYKGKDYIDMTGVKVEVTANKATLTEGKDFTVTYYKGSQQIAKNAIKDAGEYTVVVAGVSPYTGTVSRTFTIKGMDATSADVAFTDGAGVDKGEYAYTGKAITPKPTVKVGGKTLAEGTDYVLTYKGNVNAGDAKAYVQFKGNYTGVKDASFTIVPLELADADMTVEGIEDVTYSGEHRYAADAQVFVEVDGVTYTAGVKFVTEKAYEDAMKAAENDLSEVFDKATTVDAKGAGKYVALVNVAIDDNVVGYKAVPFEVAKLVLTEDNLNGFPTAVVANTPLTPSTKLTYTVGDHNAVVTVNYAWTDKDGATTTAPGVGEELLLTVNPVDSANIESDIQRMPVDVVSAASNDIALATVSLENGKYNYDWTGKAIEPTVEVKFGNDTLVKGTDFEVAYANNVNAGTATVTVTGKGDYTGTRTLTFAIAVDVAGNERAFDDAQVEVDDEGLTYDGTAKTPAVTVKVPNAANTAYIELVEGTDYVVTYTDNVNAGNNAKAVITGISNYAGAKTNKAFEIAKLDLSKAEVAWTLNTTATQTDGTANSAPLKTDAKGRYVYLHTGNALDIEVLSITADGVEVPFTTIGGMDKTDAAGVKTLTAAGDGNFENSASYEIVVAADTDLTYATVTAADVEWTGKAVQPVVTVTSLSGKTLTAGVDYSVAYRTALGTPVSAPVDLGSYVAVVTGKGTYTGMTSAAFKVTDALFEGLAFEDATVAYDGKAHSVEVSGLPEGATVTYACGDKTSSEPIVFTKVGEYEVTAYVQADGYVEWAGSAILTITEPASAGYADTEGHWAESFIDMAAAAGLMNGVGEGMFDPEAQIRRADVATILFRATYPNDESTHDPSQFAQDGTGFADAVSGAYYTSAINWAKAEGIMTGDENLVRPNDTITRAELGAMVARWAASQGVDTSAYDASFVEKCADVEDIPEWAYTSLAWTASEGILGGNADGERLVMDPQGTATRAQMAKIIVEAVNVVRA